MNMMAWEPEQRRVGSFVSLGLAVALVLGGLAVWWFVAAPAAWIYWALVGALALVLVFMLVLLFAQPRARAAAAEATPAPATEAAPVVAPLQAPAAFEPRVLTLRCGDCGTIFDVNDTGERPLYHTCPGCAAEGALRDPVEAAPAAPAEPEAVPPPSMAYAPPAEPTSASPAAPAAAVKKLKLRCGGCKEVFSIEDTGERPLKRACPHCGRIGKIG